MRSKLGLEKVYCSLANTVRLLRDHRNGGYCSKLEVRYTILDVVKALP